MLLSINGCFSHYYKDNIIIRSEGKQYQLKYLFKEKLINNKYYDFFIFHKNEIDYCFLSELNLRLFENCEYGANFFNLIKIFKETDDSDIEEALKINNINFISRTQIENKFFLDNDINIDDLKNIKFKMQFYEKDKFNNLSITNKIKFVKNHYFTQNDRS